MHMSKGLTGIPLGVCAMTTNPKRVPRPMAITSPAAAEREALQECMLRFCGSSCYMSASGIHAAMFRLHTGRERHLGTEDHGDNLWLGFRIHIMEMKQFRPNLVILVDIEPFRLGF